MLKMDFGEIYELLELLICSGEIFDKSFYKYEVYKSIMEQHFNNITDYKLRRKFDCLIRSGYIKKFPINKSYLYQFDNFNNFKCKLKNNKNYEENEKGQIIVRFD